MAGTQIFVRNREGKVFGPIEPSTVELLIDGGVLQGLLQVSVDGESYALPYRFPHVRDFFPRHLWGDDNRRDVSLDAAAPESEPAVGETPLRAALFGDDDLAGNEASPVLTSEDLGGAVVPASAAGASGRARGGDAPGPAIVTASPGESPAQVGRTPTGQFPAPPVLTAAPAEPVSAGRTPAGTPPVVSPAPPGSAAPPGRTPTGQFPVPPVLTAAPAEPISAGRAPAGTPPLVPAAPPGSTAPPGRTPTGQFPAPPVLTTEPVERPASFRPAAPGSTTVETWAEAVPFELAPPGEPKPPPRAAAPLTSAFDLLRADLAETNALRVYVQGARAGATGLFFFDLEDRTATLYLRRGNPESAESTHPSDAIGPFLVAQHLATQEQVARAEREAIKYGNDVLAALFTIGAVNPGLVFPALAHMAKDQLFGAWATENSPLEPLAWSGGWSTSVVG